MFDIARLENAYQKARQNLLQERIEQGHWVGQLSTSALSTATAVSALSAVQRAENNRLHQSLIDGGVAWLRNHQNDDGGWGDTKKSYSNISTTLLAIAAFHFAGVEKSLADCIAKAEKYVEQEGGIPGLRKRYGKDKTFAVPILANCAMAGTQSWKEVSALPFEAASVPQKFYHWMQLPVVSYAIPALVAIGQAKYFHDPPWNPVSRVMRWLSIGRTLNVLQRMQPASGGFLEAIPLTSFVVMGLSTTGRSGHEVVRKGIGFIQDSVLDDGSWPIDTNLATWTTTLSVNALSAGGRSPEELECLDWILSCQNQRVHPFTNSPPGGWGWTDLSGAVPDADDTPGALIALHHLMHAASTSDEQKKKIQQAAQLGVDWLLKLQNRDRGWPTFCRGWGKLPFDRSGADITAHCLRGIHIWREHVELPEARISNAIEKGLHYLESQQNEDGSWLPLWFGNQDNEGEENPVYGTAKVLAAYHDLGLAETSVAQKGFHWLASAQNSDGSWGGGAACGGKLLSASVDGAKCTGSVEETALAVEALLFSREKGEFQGELESGLNWLVKAVETDSYRIDSPIGFYFAKLWYHERLYPQVFAVGALGRALSKFQGQKAT